MSGGEFDRVNPVPVSGWNITAGRRYPQIPLLTDCVSSCRPVKEEIFRRLFMRLTYAHIVDSVQTVSILGEHDYSSGPTSVYLAFQPFILLLSSFRI